MRAPVSVVAVAVALALWGAVAARAQFQDPLTPAEANQVRNTAGRLDQRVPLLLQFAELRLARFEQVSAASPRPPGRAAQLYAQLTQYKEIIPELDDAMDDLAQGAATSETKSGTRDAPKVLDAAITRLQALVARLRHIQAASTPADLATYHFMLDDCLDVTSDSLQNAQEDRARAGKDVKPPPGTSGTS